jgi:hypothetical protein
MSCRKLSRGRGRTSASSISSSGPYFPLAERIAAAAASSVRPVFATTMP